jgi:hypothetical protein
MFIKNGEIYIKKNYIGKCCKQIWTRFFSVVTFYVVSCYRFQNVDQDTTPRLHEVKTRCCFFSNKFVHMYTQATK